MKKQIALFVLILIMTVTTVQSWGPNFHVDVADQVLKEDGDDTLLKDLARANEDAFFCGLEYPDSAVIYYYSDFMQYKGLHDWNTADKLWDAAKNDRQRAFALGWATHCAMDMVSHNYYIPDKIRSTKIIDAIIHPLYELNTDTHYVNVKASHSMEVHGEFDAWVATVVGRDFSEEAELLNQAIGGGEFYDEAYSIPQQGWLFKTYRVLSNVVKPFVKESMYHPYMDRTKAEVRNIFHDNYPTMDPSGELAIKGADEEAQLWQWAIGILMIVGAYWLARRKGWM